MKQCTFLLIFIFPFFNFPGSRGTELFVSETREKRSDFTPCQNGTDCDVFENAACVGGFCECGGTKFCEDKMEMKVTKLGETCMRQEDCNIERSVCKEGSCRCEDGSVGNEDQRRCLKVAKGLGDTCTDSVQCYAKVPRSGCQNKKCACQQKTHEFNGTCFNDVGLGQDCAQYGDCTKIQSARCDAGKCTCKNDHVPNGSSNKCLKIASRIHDQCLEDVQCTIKFGKAICQQGFCTCRKPYQFKTTKDMCVKDLLLGEVCTNHTDCHGIEPSESIRLECALGQCTCRSSFIEEYGSCSTSDRPCIGPHLCNGFDTEPKPGECTVGRCECAEERPYCTNQADITYTRRPIKIERKQQQTSTKKEKAKKQMGKGDAKPGSADLYFWQRGLNDSGRILYDMFHPDEETEAIYRSLCHFVIYILLFTSLVMVAFSTQHTRRLFAMYVLPVFGITIAMCVMWLADLRDALLTLISVAILGGTSISLLRIAYSIFKTVLNVGRNLQGTVHGAPNYRPGQVPIVVSPGRRRHSRSSFGGRRRDLLKQIYDWVLYILFVITPTIVTFQYFFSWRDIKHFIADYVVPVVVWSVALCYGFYLQSKYRIWLIVSAWPAIVKLTFITIFHVMVCSMCLRFVYWLKRGDEERDGLDFGSDFY